MGDTSIGGKELINQSTTNNFNFEMWDVSMGGKELVDQTQ